MRLNAVEALFFENKFVFLRYHVKAKINKKAQPMSLMLCICSFFEII
jgi:hypothetical protein